MARINFRQLQKLLPGLRKNISLKNYTTFKIGNNAQYFFEAKTKRDLIKAIQVAEKYNLLFFILAGGSNVLISDKGFKGMVIKIQNTEYKIQNTNLHADAGVPLISLMQKTIKNNLSGLEWAIGIPGSAGGAVYGNAGAFGKSMKDIIQKVEVYDLKTKKIKALKGKDCKFKYRESIFKRNKKLIILSIVLKLKKGRKKEIQEKVKEYSIYRKNSHPLNFPSAGSVFKNILNFPARELIEEAGLKGKKIGSAQISKKHANFIVNLGNAKANDVKKLINLAKKKVKNKFKINLEEEIQLVGF